jgi:RNA polymerase sigma factor (sigma-70 family)
MEFTKVFWEKVYRGQAPLLLGLCMRYVGDSALAEDLLHDAFLTAIIKAESYSGKGPFEAWLRQIVLNTVLSWFRRQKTKLQRDEFYRLEQKPLEETADLADDAGVRELILEAGFTDLELLDAASLLPEHHRLVFNLYVIDHFTHEEIARELGISAGTSKSHLARGRKKLREILYSQAMEKKKKEKDKIRAAFLLVMGDGDFLDHLYEHRFGNYSLPPAGTGTDFLDQVSWSQLSPSPTAGKQFYRSAVVKKAILILIVGAAVFTTIFFIQKKTSQPSPIKVTKIQNLIPVTKQGTITQRQAPPPSGPVKKPVIIHQTIIQHQTVTIHDTIRIHDTVHSH